MGKRGRLYVDTRGFGIYARITMANAIDGALRITGARIAMDSHSITGGYDIGRIVSQTRCGSPFTSRRGHGRAVDIVNPDDLAVIFERGSYRKGRNRSAPGNPGVKATRFLRDPLKRRKGEVIDELRRRLP